MPNCLMSTPAQSACVEASPGRQRPRPCRRTRSRIDQHPGRGPLQAAALARKTVVSRRRRP
jgi:hypothetical protein